MPVTAAVKQRQRNLPSVKASPELLDQARAKAGAQNARFLKPSDMITLEYRSDRLNLNTDNNLVVTRVNCG